MQFAAMKKYSLILSTIIFLMLFALMPKDKVFAQVSSFPSFEVYSATCGNGKNCSPYPLVDKVKFFGQGTTYYVTAHVYDVSGVPYGGVVANIEDPNNPGKYINIEDSADGSGIMYDDGQNNDGGPGDNTYGARFNTSKWDSGLDYKVDIVAQDNLLQSSGGAYVDMAHITIQNIICSNSGSVRVCASVTQHAPEFDKISSFTVNPTSVNPGDLVSLSATLEDSGNNPIGNETILFEDITNPANPVILVSKDTDPATGVASTSFNVSSTISANKIVIKAVYAPGGFVPKVQSAPFTLKIIGVGTCLVSNGATLCANITPTAAEATQISFSTPPPATISASYPVNFSVTLKDGDGNPISGESMTFTDTDSSAYEQPIDTTGQTTNASGVMNVSYVTGAYAAPGQHTITAKFDGDSLLGLLGYTKTTTMNIIGATQILFYDPSPIYPGQSGVYLSATLERADGTLIGGQTVTFTDTTDPDPANWVVIGSGTTDSTTGVAEASYPTNSNTPAGPRTITTSFAGSPASPDFLAATSALATLLVEAPTALSLQILSPTTGLPITAVAVGEPITLSATFYVNGAQWVPQCYPDTGMGASCDSVAIIFRDITDSECQFQIGYSVYTDANGVVQMNYTATTFNPCGHITSSGPHTFVAQYSDNDGMGFLASPDAPAQIYISNSIHQADLWTGGTFVSWGDNSDLADPYNIASQNSRAQFVILSGDLSAAGLGANDTISSVSLLEDSNAYWQWLRSYLRNFRIRMKLIPSNETTTTSFEDDNVEGPWTDFYGPADVSTGDLLYGSWFEYSSDAGFEWDGTSNILVDIGRNDSDNSDCVLGVCWSAGGMQVVEGVGANRMFAGYNDDPGIYNMAGSDVTVLPNNDGSAQSYDFVPALKLIYTTP
jgi:hypothetical protein